jgi:hypothetical protein
MIDDLDLNEIQLFGRSFTWSNKRPNSSFSKLDRVFLSNHWNSLTTHISYLTDLPAPTSDHAPLTLRFKNLNMHSYRNFSFQRHWIQYDEAHVLVHDVWNSVTSTSNPALDLINKFKQVRKAMKAWAIKKFKGYNKPIQWSKFIIQILDRDEKVRMLSDSKLNLKIYCT